MVARDAGASDNQDRPACDIVSTGGRCSGLMILKDATCHILGDGEDVRFGLSTDQFGQS